MDLINVIVKLLDDPDVRRYLEMIPRDKLSMAAPYFTVLGVLVHVAGPLYSWWLKNRHNSEARRRAQLMDEIGKTREFLAGLSKPEARVEDLENLKTLRVDMQEQLQDLLHRLAKTFPEPRKKDDSAVPRRHWVRRALLLYMPRHREAWMPQTLAWASLSFSAIWLGTEGIKGIGAAVFFAFFLALRAWAVTAEYWPGAAANSGLRRCILNYRPRTLVAWFAHLLYYLVVALSVAIPAVIALDPRARSVKDAIGCGAVLLSVAVAVGAWAQRYAPAPLPAAAAECQMRPASSNSRLRRHLPPAA